MPEITELKKEIRKLRKDKARLLDGVKEAKEMLMNKRILYKENSIGLMGINNLIKEMGNEK